MSITQKALSLCILLVSWNITIQARHHIMIVGGGIIGGLEALSAYQKSQDSGQDITITIFEKNSDLSSTPAMNLTPSLTPNEITYVIPKGKALVESLKKPYDQSGGTAIKDNCHMYETPKALAFIDSVMKYATDHDLYVDKTNMLLAMGEMSMRLWQNMYDTADQDLKNILYESNLHNCYQPDESQARQMFHGYRIDLRYNYPNPLPDAVSMIESFKPFGFSDSAILTPQEVMNLNPYLATYCTTHTQTGPDATLQWHDNATAIWRPGGCLYASTFLPKLYDYLQQKSGTYLHPIHGLQNNFQLHFNHQVVELLTEEIDTNHIKIIGLKFADQSTLNFDLTTDTYECILCPGSALGTLEQLGLNEPVYSKFPGVSVILHIPVPAEKIEEYKNFNCYMSLRDGDSGGSLHARYHEGEILLGISGTKSFYADSDPDIHDEFCQNRSLFLLNILNTIFPDIIGMALQKETLNETLTFADLSKLELEKIARYWAGVRAVSYDGFPTLGAIFMNQHRIINGRCTTHLGSAGIAYGPIAVWLSQQVHQELSQLDPITQKLLQYSDSRRVA